MFKLNYITILLVILSVISCQPRAKNETDQSVQSTKIGDLGTLDPLNYDHQNEIVNKIYLTENESAEAFTDSDAMNFLVDSCNHCHAPEKALANIWVMTPNYSKESFSSDPEAIKVFQSVYNATINSKKSPTMMPPDANRSPKQLKQNSLFVEWVVKNFPKKSPAVPMRSIKMNYLIS